MADNAWLVVHVLDESTYETHLVLHAEYDLSEIHEYVPTVPGDPKVLAGVKSYVVQLDGSRHYLTDSFADLVAATKAKVV